jgi:uncharacterized protein YjbI with pentapeptide repeats
MANEEHLGILKQGAKFWRQWRGENPDIRPDLRGAGLNGADLRETDLRETDLSLANLGRAYLIMADLSRADLSRADLSRAHLRKAGLGGACLHEANLHEANLREASLIMADLSRADLRAACLSGAHLSRADLRAARLGGAHICGADLFGTNLSEANLSEANLIGANFSWANLRGANLIGAHLREADLSGADLRRADLSGADFTEARVQYTMFADLDLSLVKGLETVKHWGPSTIGVDTIYKSRGNIPEVFLRGCGVQDNFIAYMGSLTGKAFEYYSCFISYSSADDAFAQRLHNDLQGKGVRCWFAPEDMKIGDKIRVRIDESIRIHDKLMIVLSEHSINSAWVEAEVETALEEEDKRKQTVLFPIRLDEAVMQTGQAWAAHIRRTRHIGDFTHWKHHDSYQQALDRLLRDLKASDA